MPSINLSPINILDEPSRFFKWQGSFSMFLNITTFDFNYSLKYCKKYLSEHGSTIVSSLVRVQEIYNV